jgi:hypothetical protein
MKRRTTILVALIAATVAIGAVPALAVDTVQPAERPRTERTFPPEWIDQTADELRAQAVERATELEGRIANADRLTEEQKAAAIAAIEDTLNAIADLDESAEVIGTVISRRQLQRIERRAARNDETADYEQHLTGDLERFTLRLEHLTKIAGWAETAGENVTAVTGYLDEASILLEVANGSGSIGERHDAAHIARAWMTEASVALMAM